MSGKIKVALCLSGEPRSSMFCFPYIYESFINLGEKYEVDVYIHTRKTFRALPLYKPKKYILDNITSNDLTQKIQNFSVSPELKTKINFHSRFTTNSNSISNQLLMLDGIQKSFQLSLLNNDPYDIYIRCRPDIFTDSLLKINSIINDILKKEYDIFIPSKDFEFNSKEYNESQSQYNDQLAIGNFKATKIYSNTFNNLEYLLQQTNEWKAENWIRTQLNYHNIKVKIGSFPIFLSREVRLQSNRGEYLFDVMFLNL